ncbi:hypothetical protein Aple_063340 [Acrocarpospora pleiomorpha]|uniref:Uncharacterized protein n=1 Tax=Acrocarpospora pleiomorpha TaxID=90975 RepID=A0A5M3XQ23_9ACTN|nr:hypothetical protein Aple_063340 [Acrocarpospora pleiomorpha]
MWCLLNIADAHQSAPDGGDGCALSTLAGVRQMTRAGGVVRRSPTSVRQAPTGSVIGQSIEGRERGNAG